MINNHRHPIAATAFAMVALIGLAVSGNARADQELDRGGVGGGGGIPNGFSGRAVVLDAVLPAPAGHVVLGDTTELPATGGNLQSSLLNLDVPPYVTGEVVHATTIGQGNNSRSEASVADATITVGGHTISAALLQSRAVATCNQGEATSSGSSSVLNLTVDTLAIAVTGDPGQTIALPDGSSIIINEQTRSGSGNYSALTVNALHVVIADPLNPGGSLADIIIASSHADITCSSTNCKGGDFITGGGWILTPSGSRGTFGVAGGLRNRAFWGHLTYIDHGLNLKVKGTGVTSYTVLTPTSRRITGTAEINGVAGTYSVDVADNGEPGRNDSFLITLSTGYTAGNLQLPAGNIQLHKPCK